LPNLTKVTTNTYNSKIQKIQTHLRNSYTRWQCCFLSRENWHTHSHVKTTHS